MNNLVSPLTGNEAEETLASDKIKRLESKVEVLVDALQRIDCREYDNLYDIIHETFEKCRKLDKEKSYEKNIDHPEFI